MLANVTLTNASLSCYIVGFGFSTKPNFSFDRHVYTNPPMDIGFVCYWQPRRPISLKRENITRKGTADGEDVFTGIKRVDASSLCGCP